VIQGLRAERAADAAQGHFDEPASPEPTAGLAAYVEWLMDQDAKSPALKLLQGKIWERGYRDGTLRGAVFPDVPDALQHWHAAGIAVAIYSSGSVLAQQLLFSTAPFGDLTPFIGHFFDTGVGPKRSPESYARISQVMGFRGGHLLFLSDVAAELAAARRAGFQTALCIRPGNAEQEGSGELVVRSFEEVVV
jgi:enolase-phosphatase E1